MEQLIQLFIFLPLAGYFVSLFFKNTDEKLISGVALATLGIQLSGLILYIGYWLISNSPTIDLKHFVFYKGLDIEIYLDFYFDKTTSVFAFLGALTTFLVLVFSKYYLHRDSGFKRFFNTILLFYFAYNIIVFAGNFETLFMGWELLGITSFLLIAFYRDRYLPIKNALKTLSIYRVGDICLILAMWASHHIWQENIPFSKLENSELVATNILEHYNFVLFLLGMVVIAATIKSAQFPFSSWLPRAMEGPTTSSAVFYGSLAVHLGVFLLLRTYPYYNTIMPIKIVIISIGVLTTFFATVTARVQSTVKTQIAYSSIAQIGIMFVEVACGLHTLALVHLFGNALLRTYQLLVSPSVLGYMIHDQFFNFIPKKIKSSKTITSKIQNSIYLLSVKEWNIDTNLQKFIWRPFKIIGKKVQFISNKTGIIFVMLLFIAGVLIANFDANLPTQLTIYIYNALALIALILILVSFTEKKNPINAWIFIVFSQFYIVLAVSLSNKQYHFSDISLYLVSLFVAAVLGLAMLKQLKAKENIDLNDFYGHLSKHQKQGGWFLIACFAMIGLPFTPAFIGLDLLFSHIHHDNYFLLICISISFVIFELAVLRIYARLFLGPSKKQTHPIAYRSS